MADERTYLSATECRDIPFPQQVEAWVRFSVVTTCGDLGRTATVLGDPGEIESLRTYAQDCIGLPVTEADITAAVSRIVTSIRKHAD